MDETEFVKAAFNPSLRPGLLDALLADHALLAAARQKVHALARDHARGQLFDRDHISKIMHEMLTRMLTQVDAMQQQPPEITVR